MNLTPGDTTLSHEEFSRVVNLARHVIAVSKGAEKRIVTVRDVTFATFILELITAGEQDIRDDVNADAAPFHALGKPRHQKTEPTLGHCECEDCRVALHASDCAVHNMPAKPNDFCSCGVTPHADPDTESLKQRGEGTATTKESISQTNVWVQPPDRAARLQRLADARDFDVPSRERENLCSVAHGEITRLADALQDLVDDSYSLIEQPSWIHLGVYRCHQCEATKGERTQGHADDCAVGRAEVVLRR